MVSLAPIMPTVKGDVKSRVIWGGPEGVCYETRRGLAQDEAVRRARFFEANSRVSRAIAVRRPDGWHVRIWPASLSRLYARLVAASKARAASEGLSYTYHPAQDGGYTVRNPRSGCSYHVTAETCTCPQWGMRASRIGAPCKHILEARRRGLFYALEVVE